MRLFSRAVHVGAVAACAAVLTGCAPIRVSTYTERNVDLARYRTYAFATSVPAATGDPRLDGNPFFHERIMAAVERQLAANGYEKVTASTPDFTIHYHVNIHQAVDVNAADTRAGYSRPGEIRPFVYEAGTLLFDFVDSSTKAVVWRGWAEHGADAMLENQELMESTVDTLVAHIFARVPRRS
jgi:hypothetical protein